MKRTLLAFGSAMLVIAIGTSSITAPKRLSHTDGSKITGYSGGCTSCHGSAVTGGSITLIGLPKTVAPSTSYTFSVHINDATTSAKNWGFDLATGAGTISTTNTYVGITSTKLNCYHSSPPAVTDTAYSFTNITWQSPATLGAVAFKFAGIAGNDNGSSSGDHSYKGTFSTTVAQTSPVTLASFVATVKESKVTLAWATATELNASHFEVERSLDGAAFTAIGKVAAKGNAASNYSYSDNASLLDGNIYYRLKSVDNDGASSYSDVKEVTVKATKSAVTNMYPNPIKTGQALNLKYVSSKSEKIAFQLISRDGKRVYNTSMNVNEGTNNLSFKISDIIPGMYYLIVLENNTNIQKLPLVVE